MTAWKEALMSTDKGNRRTNIALWTVTTLLAAMFFLSGSAKLAASESMVQSYAVWGYPLWFLYVVGASEVVGALLLFWRRTASLASLALGGIMVGAVGTHLFAGEYGASVIPVLLTVLLALVGYSRRSDLRWPRSRTETPVAAGQPHLSGAPQ
jgi:uncharacterized membrane protein YphA (DoxX/SURF4 family)